MSLSHSATADAFFDRLASDDTFRAHFMMETDAGSSPLQFAKAEGYDIDADALKAAFQARYGTPTVSKAPRSAMIDDTLSDEVLGNIAGGVLTAFHDFFRAQPD